MLNIRIENDIDRCGVLWQRLWPDQCLFDRWDVRLAFHRHFGRPPHFIVAERAGRPVGLLPLSWIEEEGYYGCFPGETWKGKTWLEQNRVPAESHDIRQQLWLAGPDDIRMRYLLPEESPGSAETDETGYLFHPLKYGGNIDAYWAEFSGKSRKQLKREASVYADRDCHFQENAFDDIDWMFETNLANFGTNSYFHDPRFQNGFDVMLTLLRDLKSLRTVTVRVNGKKAAVDVGAVYHGRYTVLAGATDPAFPGIAKTINLFHLEWGCGRKFDEIDFLCGDFGWKTRFHLHPRPLCIARKNAAEHYEIKHTAKAAVLEAS
ncbi:MAG: GNAT family N-acetyltransferase [Thermodesulfobacteriota bacterium]